MKDKDVVRKYESYNNRVLVEHTYKNEKDPGLRDKYLTFKKMTQ